MGISANVARTPMIAGNWKMNMTASKTRPELISLLSKVSDVADRDIVVCPSFTSIQSAVEVTKGTNISIGAQNMHFEKEGAYTGEVSGEMLNDLGVTHVILGHSERRQYFGETDEMVNDKIFAALRNNLTPIICVGENLDERNESMHFMKILDQLSKGLKSITSADMLKSVIAYEPIWAIDTGVVATPEQAQEVHEYIRKTLSDLFDVQTANSIRILYGGSVKPDNISDLVRMLYGGSVKPGNISDLMSQPDIDGALVGGKSLKADDFALIVNYQI